MGETGNYRIVFKCTLASLEKYCKLCSTMRWHSGLRGQERFPREESDVGAGIDRKNRDEVKFGGSSAKALWSWRSSTCRRNWKKAVEWEKQIVWYKMSPVWLEPLAATSPFRSLWIVLRRQMILRTVGSCCNALLSVALHLDSVHLDLHFGKSLWLLCWCGPEERLNLEWWLSVCRFFCFHFSSGLWGSGLI